MARKEKGGGSSLQDQLRQAGLVSEKQLRSARKGIHRKEMQVKRGQAVDEDRIEAQRALAEKEAADRARNLERERQAETRSVMAQVKQLIEMNTMLETGDVPYDFQEEKKVKRIYVSASNKTQLNRGFLAIVKHTDRYDLVPEKVALKIMSRRDDVVLYLYDRAGEVEDPDDPYKDYKIPDDLDW